MSEGNFKEFADRIQRTGREIAQLRAALRRDKRKQVDRLIDEADGRVKAAKSTRVPGPGAPVREDVSKSGDALSQKSVDGLPEHTAASSQGLPPRKGTRGKSLPRTDNVGCDSSHLDGNGAMNRTLRPGDAQDSPSPCTRGEGGGEGLRSVKASKRQKSARKVVDVVPLDVERKEPSPQPSPRVQGEGGGSPGLQRARAWYASRGQTPFPFQFDAWQAFIDGHSGLIQAPTGMGKTLAAALGPMIDYIDRGGKSRGAPPLTLLWLTPLRALANDTVEALKAALSGMGLGWTVELRTSDTTSTTRARQKLRLPSILVTTPESLSLLLSYPGVADRFATLRSVVVDEWHELLGTKRGVQAELGLARLRSVLPELRVWGLSATIANTGEAASALLGPQRAGQRKIIAAPDDKKIELVSILPDTIERFPWAGHLGLKMVDPVVRTIEQAGTSLVFTNTRSQSELWFRALMQQKPEWVGEIAVHHGSIDRKLRQSIEQMLREGKLKAAVCTSSLDLGVDFFPVEQVMQIGSPKSVSRAIQRAGRSGHRPGEVSRLICVPTQAIELIEFSAARYAIEHRAVEAREPIFLALDVLAQHVVTVATGDGFYERELYDEVRTTHAYGALTREHWQWVLDFAERGGKSLTAYPRFARIKQEADGRWISASAELSRMHRMSIGTITADGSVLVQFVSGRKLGIVEESFIAKLRHGDKFHFSGRLLEFVKVQDMTALVKLATNKSGTVPRWMGARFPISASLADSVRMRLEEAADGKFVDREMQAVQSLLELQGRWSKIPRRHQILIESAHTRDGYHHYLFPFQGRLVHEGLSALLAFRLKVEGIGPVTASFNDYGLELHSPDVFERTADDWKRLLSPQFLIEDVLACVNSGELAKRHFREIARIAGLLVPTQPGQRKSARQLQASSGLFWDVLNEFDPENLLLDQARREVLERQLEFSRLRKALEQIQNEAFIISETNRLSPLAFPLWAERIGSQQLRFESSADRIERLALQLEAEAQEDEVTDDARQL